MARTLYFGGPNEPWQNRDRPVDLETVPQTEFHALFGEWVQQIWMQETAVPNDEQALKDFNISELVVLFKTRYLQGDWKRIIRGRGTTPEWFVLWLQLLSRRPVAIVLNSDLPLQPTGRIKQKLLLDSGEIGACLIQHLRALSRSSKQESHRARMDLLGYGNMAGTAVMLYDGKIGHVIQARTIDDSLNWLGYDDFTWREGSSMLCAGENAAGVDARYYGQAEIGQWVTSAISLPPLIYGIPIQADLLSVWGEWAEAYRRQLNRLLDRHS